MGIFTKLHGVCQKRRAKAKVAKAKILTGKVQRGQDAIQQEYGLVQRKQVVASPVGKMSLPSRTKSIGGYREFKHQPTGPRVVSAHVIGAGKTTSPRPHASAKAHNMKPQGTGGIVSTTASLTLSVRTKDQQTAHYRIQRQESQVRSTITPTAHHVGIPFIGDLMETSRLLQTQDTTTEQIIKLANLKDQGILTKKEFKAKKKQLLGL